METLLLDHVICNFYSMDGTLVLAYYANDGSKVKNRWPQWVFGSGDFVDRAATKICNWHDPV